MIKERFIYYKNRNAFDTDLQNNNLKDTHIAFIEDDGLIWTHNHFFGDSQSGSQSGMTDEERAMLEELYEKQNPLVFSVSLKGADIVEKNGQPYEVQIQYSLSKGGKAVVPTSITLNGQAVEPKSSDILTATAPANADSTSYTVTAVYDGKTVSKTVTFRQMLSSYYGFAPEGELPDLGSLNKYFSTSVSMLNNMTRQGVNNPTTGYHLWIVTPHTISKVATDESYVYPVAMNSKIASGGFNYYSSVDGIMSGTLNYYIK